MTLLDNVNKFCIEQKMTLSELEEMCGFDKGTLMKWDKKSPSISNANKVAMFFGLTIDELVRGKRGKKRINPIPLKDRFAVSIDEASFLLSTTRPNIDRLVKAGELSTYRINGSQKIPVGALIDYQNKCMERGR